MTASDSKPPFNNMGAEITNQTLDQKTVVFPLENRIIIDWLRITFLDTPCHITAIERIGLNPDLFVIRPQGGNGYKSAVAFGGITVLFDGSRNMGVHVNFSGDGCRLYESQYPENPWLHLFEVCIEHNANITRLDLAHDNIDGIHGLCLFYQGSLTGPRRCSLHLFHEPSDGAIHDGNVFDKPTGQ